MEEINNSGSLEVTLDGTKHVIAKEDLLIEAKRLKDMLQQKMEDILL